MYKRQGCGKEGATPEPNPRVTSKAESATTESATAALPKLVPTEFVDVVVDSALPPMKVPADNPMTPEKIELGELLFFDTALSVDHSMSCATCHDPELGWSNGEELAEGTSGLRGKRNTLSILNVGFYDQHLFWDGRVKTLEEQALVPVFEKTEMAMTSEAELLERIEENEDYRERFAKVFEDGITAANVARALATFCLLYTSPSPRD